jgi:hypothetical protein
VALAAAISGRNCCSRARTVEQGGWSCM